MNIDLIFMKMFYFIFLGLKFIMLPLKYLSGLLLSVFQRPYSFCLFFSFIIIVSPLIMMLVISIQFDDYIYSLEHFSFIYYYTMFSLVISYYIVFHIYSLYGIHYLEEEVISYNIKTFTQFIIRYLFRETRAGFLGLFCIGNLIFFAFILNYLETNNDYNSENFSIPVIVYILKLSVIFNILFYAKKVFIFTLLYLFIVCKINKSCLCGLVYSLITKSELNKISYVEEEKVEFYDLGLEFFSFLGVFDYRKKIWKGYIRASSQIEEI